MKTVNGKVNGTPVKIKADYKAALLDDLALDRRDSLISGLKFYAREMGNPDQPDGMREVYATFVLGISRQIAKLRLETPVEFPIEALVKVDGEEKYKGCSPPFNKYFDPRIPMKLGLAFQDGMIVYSFERCAPNGKIKHEL